MDLTLIDSPEQKAWQEEVRSFLDEALPEHGSDLAGLETRAERDGDEWVINGQKTFGTGAHRCEWMFVFARTDQNVPKHAGLSAFLVPLDVPGLAMRPMYNIAGGRQNLT